jgi:hypothetical protein
MCRSIEISKKSSILAPVEDAPSWIVQVLRRVFRCNNSGVQKRHASEQEFFWFQAKTPNFLRRGSLGRGAARGSGWDKTLRATNAYVFRLPSN